MEKVRNTIKNEINWQDIPEELEHIAVDMAAGEFLQAKKTFQPDDLEHFDLVCAVKQIQYIKSSINKRNMIVVLI